MGASLRSGSFASYVKTTRSGRSLRGKWLPNQYERCSSTAKFSIRSRTTASTLGSLLVSISGASRSTDRSLQASKASAV